MFTDYTWQDWQATPEGERAELIDKIVAAYKSSQDCVHALKAMDYFLGENTEIRKKKSMELEVDNHKDARGVTVTREKTVEVKGIQIPGGFFGTFVVQQNQFLLGNGMSIAAVEAEDGTKETDAKARLGVGFDTTLARMGEKALTHGVCYGYWNADHLEIIPAVTDVRSGCAVLMDEMTSAIMVAVQYWQLSDKRSMYVRVFEPDGVTMYRREKKEGTLRLLEEKRPYVLRVRSDLAGEMVVDGANYNALPVIPLYANEERRSELTENIKAKIDAYDRILSDYSDNLDRANDVYWVLNNYGGTDKDILAMLAKIRELKAVVSMSDGMGTSSTAEPHTFEVPYAAREKALEILKKALYRDYMALDTEALTGGSLTNVAIQVAMSYINLKCDRYEWQVLTFLRQLFRLLGMEECADRVTLTRRTITNDDEIIREIYESRQDIDQRTALRLNPMINPDDVEGIVEATQAEKMTRAPSFEDVDKLLADQQARLRMLQQPKEPEDGGGTVTDDEG